MKFIFSLLILMIFEVKPTVAADHYPFSLENQKFTPPYFADVEGQFFIGDSLVEEGDRLILETGEVLIFHKFLGKGTNTIIFEDSLGRAVRMNINYMKNQKRVTFQSFAEAMEVVNRNLSSSRSTSVLANQMQSEHVLLVEKVEIEITAIDFLNLSELQRNDPRYLELVSFINSFRIFSLVNDFHPYQIGFVKNRGWLLFDVGTDVELAADTDGEKGLSNSELLMDWQYHIPVPVFNNLRRDLEGDFHARQRSVGALTCRMIL